MRAIYTYVCIFYVHTYLYKNRICTELKTKCLTYQTIEPKIIYHTIFNFFFLIYFTGYFYICCYYIKESFTIFIYRNKEFLKMLIMNTWTNLLKVDICINNVSDEAFKNCFLFSHLIHILKIWRFRTLQRNYSQYALVHHQCKSHPLFK